MLPDTLPVLGNGAGDVLCLRFGTNDTLAEIVEWSHDGGWWRPYGNSFTEALIFDAVLTIEERRIHSDGAVRVPPLSFVRWAMQWLPENSATLPLDDIIEAGDSSLLKLLSSDVAVVPTLGELCKAALTNRFYQECCRRGGRRIATQSGILWKDIEPLLFDERLMPSDFRNRLSGVVNIAQDDLFFQDWDAAVQHAAEASRLRRDICWPRAVLGWGAERNGNAQLAIQHYRDGLMSLGSSADFTQIWRGGAGMLRYKKFALARLKTLSAGEALDIAEKHYIECGMTRSGTRGYWISLAESAERDGRFDDAYRAYYAAGWDEFQANDSTIIESLARVASLAGFNALHSIAKRHAVSGL
jgi:hypothetical protein